MYETNSKINITLCCSLESAPQTVATESASGTELCGAEDLEAIRLETKEKLFIDVRNWCICREVSVVQPVSDQTQNFQILVAQSVALGPAGMVTPEGCLGGRTPGPTPDPLLRTCS